MSMSNIEKKASIENINTNVNKKDYFFLDSFRFKINYWFLRHMSYWIADIYTST
jgi:hypothetical protein